MPAPALSPPPRRCRGRARGAATRLDAGVAAELAPLRLDKARFRTVLTPLDEADWSEHGCERVHFEIATTPGAPFGPLARIASGGELSRFMLALKLVLAGTSSVPTLIFDEVDSGIGGAVAAAVGERLQRLGTSLQVLVVTHSPQVAARGAHHWRVAKHLARVPDRDPRRGARPGYETGGDRPHAVRPHRHRRGARRGREPDRRRPRMSASAASRQRREQSPVDALTEEEARDELAWLAAEIKRHDRLYYTEAAPEISDADYDALRRRNAAIEARFPELIRADSPSRRVGAAPATGFAKVTHSRPMLSLENAFEEADVREFFAGIRNFFRRTATEALVAEDVIEIMAEPKIDGLSIGLSYRARPPRAGRDARRRRHRRKRHRQHPHPRERARSARRQGLARADRDPRRSLYRARRVFRLERRARGRGRTGLRQSAQRRRRLAAPARSGDHRAPAAQILCLCLGRSERAVRPHP